jgi:hypothetical protein
MKIPHSFTLQQQKDTSSTLSQTLDTQDGRTISTHYEKAALIWEEYRNKLGCSTQPQMHFTLQQLVQEHDLQSIAEPFTKEDIHDS